MFNFLKKKQSKQMLDWEFELLRQVVARLPDKYTFLVSQIDKEFIVDSVPNEILKNGWKRVILDQNLYLMKKKEDMNCQIQGVKVFELSLGEFREIQLDVFEGVLIGYRVFGSQFDLTKIDTTGLREVRYSDSVDDSKYLRNIKDKKSKFLALKNSIGIEVFGKEYYVVKDFEDGNYLSVDVDGKVYGMFHDPLIIEVIDDSVSNFIDKVNAGEFLIDKYYESKF